MSQDILPLGDFAKVQPQGADFIRLANANHLLPPPPRFAFGAVPASVMAGYFNHVGLSSVGVYKLQEFELQGAFLLKANDVYYRCPEINVHEAHIETEVARIAGAETSVQRRLEGSYAVLAGPGYKVYGHWLVEYLPKISLLSFAGYDIFSLRYLLPTDTPAYVKAWLLLLGIAAEQIISYDPLTEPVVADELLVPTIMHNGVRMSSLFNESAEFLRRLLVNRHNLQGPSPGGRIFLSRAQTGLGRRLKNRARIEELATAANFTVISPEKLTLLEQVQLFIGAREIMGEYGSGLHGSMFSPAGTVICALRGTGGHPGFIQSGMGDVLGHPTGYVFGTLLGSDPNGEFEVQEGDVADALKLAFGGFKI